METQRFAPAFPAVLQVKLVREPENELKDGLPSFNFLVNIFNKKCHRICHKIKKNNKKVKKKKLYNKFFFGYAIFASQV